MRSKAWIALSQHIGIGRRSGNGELLLTVERCGGAGLLWPLTIAGRACRAWCEESAWCRWVEPLLPVPTLAQIDKTLLAPLANWSWLPLTEVLAEEGSTEVLQIASPASGDITPEWEAVLTLVRDETRLSLRLIDWPAQWLIERSADWLSTAVNQVPPVAMTVAAGWCSLPSRSLEQIQLGEGLLLSGSVDLTHGVAWLFQTRPLAKIRFSTANQAEIEATMADSSEWPPEAGSDADDIIVTVVAEIGQLMLPLERLATLAVGEILQGESLFDGEVRLKINGRYLGNGSLIEVGGRWVVRINRWFNQPPATVPVVINTAIPEPALLVTSLSVTEGRVEGVVRQAPADELAPTAASEALDITTSPDSAVERIDTTTAPDTAIEGTEVTAPSRQSTVKRAATTVASAESIVVPETVPVVAISPEVAPPDTRVGPDATVPQRRGVSRRSAPVSTTLSITTKQVTKPTILVTTPVSSNGTIKAVLGSMADAMAEQGNGQQDKVKRSEVKQSEVKQPEVKQPEVKQPEVKQPEVKQPEVKRPEVKQSEVKQSEVKQSEVKQPEVKQPEVKQSEVKQSEVKQSEVKQSEVKQPEVKQSEVKQPEVKQSEVKQPEVKQPEVKQSEVKQPEVKQPEVKQKDERRKAGG